RFRGRFEVTREHITHLYHLVEQRVQRQNQASLVQFSVRILYGNGSSVLLNSFADFDSYNEVQNLNSIGAILTWTYLIQFKDKPAPEKQEVSVSIGVADHSRFRGYFSRHVTDEESHMIADSEISLVIKHTERSWGFDIENLLS